MVAAGTKSRRSSMSHRKARLLAAAAVTGVLPLLALAPPASASGGIGSCEIPAGANVVLGTAGDDVLTGTSGDDVIDGRGGNDQIDGRGGNDILLGSGGEDGIAGGGG